MSFFMRSFQKKSQNLLKVKKNYDQFLTQYASRLLQPVYQIYYVYITCRDAKTYELMNKVHVTFFLAWVKSVQNFTLFFQEREL